MKVLTLLLGMAIIVIAFWIGRRERKASHSLRASTDPLVFFVYLLEIVALIPIFAGFTPIFSVDFSARELTEMFKVEDIFWILMIIVIGFDVGLSIGFRSITPDDVIVLDIPMGNHYEKTRIVPLVYYQLNGNLYTMPQNLKGIFLSMLGARHPLEMPIHEVARYREYEVSGDGILNYSFVPEAATVATYDVEEVPVGLIRIGTRKIRDENKNVIGEKPRYMFRTIVKIHKVTFANSAIEDYQQFIIKSELHKDAIYENVKAHEAMARMQIQIQAMKYEDAADLLEGLIDKTVDAPGAHEQIVKAIEAERMRRSGGEANAE